MNVLYEPSLFEGSIRPVLVDSFDRFCGDSHLYCFVYFWYKNAYLFKVYVSTHLSARVKLRSTRAVAVAPAHL